MSETVLFSWLLPVWGGLASVVGILLLWVNAPYGRHWRPGWGPVLNSRVGWLVMESVAALLFALFFVLGQAHGIVPWIFLLLWEGHYVHRAFIYPFTRRGATQPMPLAVVTMGLVFNTVNAYLNGRYLFTFAGGFSLIWLSDPRFVLGFITFVTGFVINRAAERTLRRLRRTPTDGYSIPYGGMYRWVSCPNYLGEIMLWVGWAMLTWSWAGVAFAAWTIANLAPRARANHAWYRAHFPDYPTERRALLPELW